MNTGIAVEDDIGTGDRVYTVRLSALDLQRISPGDIAYANSLSVAPGGPAGKLLALAWLINALDNTGRIAR